MGKVGETDLTWYLDLAFGFEVIVFGIWYLVFGNLGGSRGNGLSITEQQLGPYRTGGDHVNGHCHSHSHRNVTHTGCWTTSPSWLTPPEAVYVTMCFYPQSHFSQFSLTARPQLCQKSLGIVTNISMQLKAVLTTRVTDATNKCNNYLMRRTHIIMVNIPCKDVDCSSLCMVPSGDYKWCLQVVGCCDCIFR